jgi:hypothetical protein
MQYLLDGVVVGVTVGITGEDVPDDQPTSDEAKSTPFFPGGSPIDGWRGEIMLWKISSFLHDENPLTIEGGKSEVRRESWRSEWRRRRRMLQATRERTT